MRSQRKNNVLLHQQQMRAIYGNTNGGIQPIRGLKPSEIAQLVEMQSSKRDVRESKEEAAQKSHSSLQISQRPSLMSQVVQRPAETSHSRVSISTTFALTLASKPKVRRRPFLIPPLQVNEKPTPKHIVTIDTSKARGNTDVVRLVARDLGWKECPWPRRDQPCDVTWHAVSFYDQPDIFSGQVNKFPGSLEVFHKVNLFRQLELMKQMYPDDFNFFPRTWLLPQQYHEFSNDVRHLSERRGRHKPTFIIKPSEGSQGEGIYLIRDPQQYAGPNNRSHVAQEYLANVLLLDGFKFDLRVYAVLRSLDPLEVHICHEGLARFSTVQYEQPSNRNLGETYMHLTNYSLNKRSATFDKSEKEDEGSKRKLTSVFRRLQRMGYDTQRLWVTIERIVCKTLMAVIGELKVELQSVISPCKPHPTCFQVLGFDILLLKDLRPVLLEVNSNPSLSIMGEQEVAPGIVEYIPSIKDEEVKRALIRDTLILIAPKNKKTRRRRKKRHHRTQVTVEDMEVDPPPSIKLTRHRNRKRERDISIRIVEEDPPVPETVKSIFAENQPRPLVRQETCRVFHEAQGEQTNVESPPMPPSPHLRGPVFLDAGDQHLPALTQQQSPTGGENKQLVAFMEGDVDISSQPLPNYPYPESSEDEDGEEEEESCLKEIYPALYADDLQHLRVMDRLADVFIGCLSVRGCSRMGPTAFRMFARKCRLNRKGMTNASIDILYIDVKRKWEMLNPDMTAGLSFHGFVDICFEIARRKFHTNSKAKMMEELVNYCEENLKHRAVEEEVSPTRLSAQMSRVPKRSVNLFPRRTITSLEEETEKFFPRRITSLEEDTDNSSFQHRKSYTAEMNNLIREIHKRHYAPSPMSLLLPEGE